MDPQSVVDILMVEDSPLDADLMIRALKKHNLANHVMVVEDGAAALDFLFDRGKYEHQRLSLGPKVVFLDLKLPKVSGLEVLRALRQDERTKMLPIVVVSSSGEDPDIQAAYSLGANGYVVKPVEFSAFADAMARVGMFWLLVNQPPR